MKKILYRIFHIFRYIACTPFVLAFGIITAPLSLIFGWKGFYILYVANQKSCSLKEAKEMLAKGDKYKSVSNSLIIANSNNRNNDFFNRSSSSNLEQQSYQRRNSPMYSHLSQNIFYGSN